MSEIPHLTYRTVGLDVFPISFDGVEVGSISLCTRTGKPDVWHRGVDSMPLMDRGGRVPSGDASFEQARDAFKFAFTIWHQGLTPGRWETNRDYIKHAAERSRNSL